MSSASPQQPLRLVFWQNCLSPHQLPYIQELKNDDRVGEVIYITDEEVNADRTVMGWTKFQTSTSIRVILNPSDREIEQVFTEVPEHSWHLFGGLRGSHFVTKAFRMSLNYDIHRANITEPPYTYAFRHTNGKPLWLHRLRFFFQDLRYAKYIQKIFAIGGKAYKYFSEVYHGWEVLPFMYCTELQTSNFEGITNHATPRFIFVGSLSPRKSPLTILEASRQLEAYQLVFVGDGAERAAMERYIHKHQLKNVSMLGTMNNDKISEELKRADILILPSIHDGWGAVVNEALHEGVYVLCTHESGAKDLLIDKRIGQLFTAKSASQLALLMKECIKEIDAIRHNRVLRYQWAKNYISGKPLAKYLVDSLLDIPSAPPWRTSMG